MFAHKWPITCKIVARNWELAQARPLSATKICKGKSWNLPDFDIPTTSDGETKIKKKSKEGIVIINPAKKIRATDTKIKNFNLPTVPDNWRKKRDYSEWQRQMFSLKEKFQGQSWNPEKKISREAMEGIRMLKQQFPDTKASTFAEYFRISPEAIRRILRVKWRPNSEEEEKIYQRWVKRGQKIHSILYNKEDQDEPKTHSRGRSKNINYGNKIDNRHAQADKSNKNNKNMQKKDRNLHSMMF